MVGRTSPKELQLALDRAAKDPSDANLRIAAHAARDIIVGICTKVIYSKQLAIDTIEECLTKLLLAIRDGKFKPGGNAPTWVTRLVKNECFSKLRHLERKKNRSFVFARGIGDVDEKAVAYHPYDPFYDEPTTTVVYQAVAQLPDQLSTVIVLRYWVEWSFQRMAIELDTPANTLQSRCAKAVEKLRQKLRAEVRS